MHLSTEERAVSRMLEPFGEVGGDDSQMKDTNISSVACVIALGVRLGAVRGQILNSFHLSVRYAISSSKNHCTKFNQI